MNYQYNFYNEMVIDNFAGGGISARQLPELAYKTKLQSMHELDRAVCR